MRLGYVLILRKNYEQHYVLGFSRSKKRWLKLTLKAFFYNEALLEKN